MSPVPNSMEICPVRNRADTCGRTDMMKLTVACRNYSNAPKNSSRPTKKKKHCIFITKTIRLMMLREIIAVRLGARKYATWSKFVVLLM